jgi:hypothetical protein
VILSVERPQHFLKRGKRHTRRDVNLAAQDAAAGPWIDLGDRGDDSVGLIPNEFGDIAELATDDFGVGRTNLSADFRGGRFNFTQRSVHDATPVHNMKRLLITALIVLALIALMVFIAITLQPAPTPIFMR